MKINGNCWKIQVIFLQWGPTSVIVGVNIRGEIITTTTTTPQTTLSPSTATTDPPKTTQPGPSTTDQDDISSMEQMIKFENCKN